jgi:hypothetical protein
VKKFAASLAIVILSAQTSAAGTTFKSNMVAYTPICDAGACLPLGSGCGTNSDCNLGAFSPKSKISLKGSGELKILLKGVVDQLGATASGEYIVGISLAEEQGVTRDLFIKVPVDNGSGKAAADLSSFMGPAGDRVFVFGQGVVTPGLPSECPGTNSVEDIAAREGACAGGNILGVIGLFPDPSVKTLLKSNATPFQPVCLGGGTCEPTGDICAVNSDCVAGTLSGKSKASLSGTGELKLAIKGVADSAGEPASGDYILFAVLQAQSATQVVTLKIPVDNGSGKIDVDMSGFMQSGQTLVFYSPLLRQPPVNPGDCPGTGNSVDDILSRQGVLACLTGTEIGTIGVTSGL